MAEEDHQMEQKVAEPKEHSPVHGACTRWLLRRKRMRLLRWIALPKTESEKQARGRAQQLQFQSQIKKRLYCYWLVLLCVGLGLCLERYTNSRTARQEDGYCGRTHRLGDMVTHVRRQVLHQEEALDQLERALDNATFRNIALVGSSGVGKSETARTLRETFPWPENVKTLSWRESPSLPRIHSMLKNILLCGRNLILIDDLTPLDGHLVPIINELIRGRKEIAQGSSSKKPESDPRLKQLTSIFMFTVDRQQPEEIFQAEIAALKQLPETHVIIYAALEPSHLEDCKNLGDSKEADIKDKDKVKVHGCKANDAHKLLAAEETYKTLSFNFLY
ncbi:hypothetical protein KR032_008467 [Drosophila birchii]|nr:hypothetical protein KR032_008467 [Drosophila birchii]